MKARSPAPRPAAPQKLVRRAYSDIVDGPFDDLAHTLDVRRFRGPYGRYNIPKINFHLFRLQAFQIRLATPVGFGAGRFVLDPSGRDTTAVPAAQSPR